MLRGCGPIFTKLKRNYYFIPTMTSSLGRLKLGIDKRLLSCYNICMNKICTKCKKIKTIVEFPKSIQNKSGTSSWCKKCSNEAIYTRKKKLKAQGLCVRGCGEKLFSTNHCEKHFKAMISTSRESGRRLRENVLKHYGNKCTCCGETQLKFLTFEHKNGDGAKHRKKIGIVGGGSRMVGWLIKNNYPNFIEILCYNCNCARGFWGQCPHEAYE